MTDKLCKNCQCCIIREYDEEYDFAEGWQLSFKDCPIEEWFLSVWYTENHKEAGYICNLDTLKPPDCANCFKERLP